MISRGGAAKRLAANAQGAKKDANESGIMVSGVILETGRQVLADSLRAI